MKNYWKWILLLLLSALVMTGCTPSILVTPTPTPDTRLTEIASSIEELQAELDRVAPTLTALVRESSQATALASPTRQLSPTSTSQPTTSSTTTPTFLPLPTSTLGQPQATITPAGSSVGSGVPNVLPSPTPVTAPGVLLLQDDFNSQAGWYTEENDRFKIDYLGGGYRFYIYTMNNPIWSVRSPTYEDVRIEVDASQVSGPQDGYYGLVCRYQDSQNYYLLVVSGVGDFGIGKVKDGDLRYLNFTTEFGGRLRPEGNRLRADCVGDRLALSVNGEEVLITSDSDFKTGAIGLVAGNRASPGTEVIFDNFVVLRP